MPAADGYTLALEEARRALGEQEQADEPLAADDVRREVALQLGVLIRRNERELVRMITSFNTGSVLLAIEIVAWIVSVAIGH